MRTVPKAVACVTKVAADGGCNPPLVADGMGKGAVDRKAIVEFMGGYWNAMLKNTNGSGIKPTISLLISSSRAMMPVRNYNKRHNLMMIITMNFLTKQLAVKLFLIF